MTKPSPLRRKRSSLVAGLRRMCAEQPPGRSYSVQEIAARVKCSARNIQYIERGALEKIRRRVRPFTQEMGIPLQ